MPSAACVVQPETRHLHFGDGTVDTLEIKPYVKVHNVSATRRESYLKEIAATGAQMIFDLKHRL